MTWINARRWELGTLVLGLLSYGAFTFLISGGQPTGPGLFLAFAVVALAVSSRLLFRAARMLVQGGMAADDVQAIGRRRKELSREYFLVKRALKELELDHSMGKLSAADYQEIRGRYRERAIRLMRQLDQQLSYRTQIEADLQARRLALGAAKEAMAEATAALGPVGVPEAPAPQISISPVVVSPVVVSPVASMAAAAPDAEAPRPATGEKPRRRRRPCPRCAAKNDMDAAFCKKCGQKFAA